jgi:integral membrane protein (TIGR01906 family)
VKVKNFLLILIPLFILLFNLQFLIFNYNYSFENKTINDNLLDYLNSKEELKFNYTEREIIHLHDVKNLVNILRIMIYILLLMIIILFITNKNFSYMLIISGLITIGIILIILLFNFNLLFVKFHELLFTNDYWLLPENSLLINTYPIEFFMGFFKRLILNIIITSSILIGIGIIKNVHTKHKSSNS